MPDFRYKSIFNMGKRMYTVLPLYGCTTKSTASRNCCKQKMNFPILQIVFWKVYSTT